MIGKRLLFVFIVIQTVSADWAQNNLAGIEVATRMGDDLGNFTDESEARFGSLQFGFTSPSYISNWWCVKMFEATKSWDDNYLCSNLNIGLHWIWDARAWRTDLKCVATAEPSDKYWNDNSLCLPVQSKIELVWSYLGSVNQMQCIQLYDPAAPSYTHDNFLCWKEYQ